MADVRDADGEQNAGLYSTSANVHINVEPDGFEILLAPPTKQAANTTQRYSISTGRLGIDLSAVRPPNPLPSRQQSGLSEGVQEHHLHANKQL
jgi:hypothetical protein